MATGLIPPWIGGPTDVAEPFMQGAGIGLRAAALAQQAQQEAMQLQARMAMAAEENARQERESEARRAVERERNRIVEADRREQRANQQALYNIRATEVGLKAKQAALGFAMSARVKELVDSGVPEPRALWQATLEFRRVPTSAMVNALPQDATYESIKDESGNVVGRRFGKSIHWVDQTTPRMTPQQRISEHIDQRKADKLVDRLDQTATKLAEATTPEDKIRLMTERVSLRNQLNALANRGAIVPPSTVTSANAPVAPPDSLAERMIQTNPQIDLRSQMTPIAQRTNAPAAVTPRRVLVQRKSDGKKFWYPNAADVPTDQFTILE